VLSPPAIALVAPSFTVTVAPAHAAPLMLAGLISAYCAAGFDQHAPT
jgi:hypothetical protein